MNKIKYLLVIVFMSSSVAQAASSGAFGVYVGAGFPYLGQAGANFILSDVLSFSAGYNILDLDVDEVSVKLTMPEVMVNFHPFAGAFFVGLGFGKESLEVSATEVGTNTPIKVEVDANTTIAKLGWMWGADNGGFWFGIDTAYIMPSGSDITITAPGVPTSDQNYLDAVEAAEDFGDAAYPNITFARFGFLF